MWPPARPPAAPTPLLPAPGQSAAGPQVSGAAASSPLLALLQIALHRTDPDSKTHIPQFPRAVSGNYACPAIPGYFGPGASLPVTRVTQKDRYTSSAYCVQCPRIVAVSPPKPMDQ